MRFSFEHRAQFDGVQHFHQKGEPLDFQEELSDQIETTSIQNIRSSKEIPESKRIPKGCFLRDGKRKILIVRDQFLEWWFSQLEPA